MTTESAMTLGKFYVDNDMVEELREVPDKALVPTMKRSDGNTGSGTGNLSTAGYAQSQP